MIKISRSKKLLGQLTRRDVLQGITVSNFLFFGFGSTEKRARAGLLPTLRQAEGPFYPIKKPIDQDADLTFVSTRKKRAQGEICIIRGRVFDVNGKPSQCILKFKHLVSTPIPDEFEYEPIIVVAIILYYNYKIKY